MRRIISTVDRPYNEFFAKALETLDACKDNIVGIGIVGLTDNYNNPYIVNYQARDEYDLGVMASVLQRMAWSEALMRDLKGLNEDFEEYEECEDESDE